MQTRIEIPLTHKAKTHGFLGYVPGLADLLVNSVDSRTGVPLRRRALTRAFNHRKSFAANLLRHKIDIFGVIQEGSHISPVLLYVSATIFNNMVPISA